MRSRKSAKTAGARFERQIADYLAQALDDDRIDRMVRRGTDDRGDIGGLRLNGLPLTIEVKNCTRQDLPGWVGEAHREAGNADAIAGLVIAKRHGNADPASQWVHMEVRDLVALLTGEPQPGRYDG